MSLVASRVSLVHLVTIQRDANIDTPNPHGTPSSPEWEDHLTDVQCRFWTTSGSEPMTSGTAAVVESMKMILPLGTDVTELDRLGDVTYRGDTIAAGPIGIRAIIHRKDHLELGLVQIGS